MKLVNLGDYVEIRGGGTPSRKKSSYWNGDICWASVKDLDDTKLQKTKEKITHEGLKNSASSLIPEGNVIIATRMALGKAVINEIDIAINQDLKALIPKDEFDVRFLLHFLLTKSWEIERQGTGATVKGVKLDVIKSLRIPFLPLPEQKRIAAILDKADAIRRKRQETLTLTENLIQSIFLDMFGDPMSNPNKYPVLPLAKLITEDGLQNGAYYPKDKYTPIDCGVPMVHMSDAFYGKVNLAGLKRVDASDDDIKKYRLEHTDVLVARRSLNIEGAAKPCLVQQSAESLIFESSLIRVRPKKGMLRAQFLYHYLSNQNARKKYLKKYITQSTISGINQKNLSCVEIVLPPVEIQDSFIRVLDNISKLHEIKVSFIQESNNLFNSLQQRAFSGELSNN